jgi:hypothetical protein
MRMIIEDTWFPACTKIRIGLGADELSFRRCSFEGGEIFIETGVDRRIFSRCLFQHTRFSGQPLSDRIADSCHSAAVGTEAAAMAPTGVRRDKFRR